MPSVAASLLDNPKLGLEELASEALIDVITQIADSLDPLNQKLIAVSETSKRLSEDCGDDTLTNGPLGSESDTDKATCPAPSLPIPKTIPTEGLAVSYLLKFYNNINVYERDHPKKSSEPPLSDLLQNLRTMLVNHLVLVLRGVFDLEKCSKTPLLPYILIGNTPIGLMPELMQATYKAHGATGTSEMMDEVSDRETRPSTYRVSEQEVTQSVGRCSCRCCWACARRCGAACRRWWGAGTARRCARCVRCASCARGRATPRAPSARCSRACPASAQAK